MDDLFKKLLNFYQINEEQYFYLTRDIDFSSFLLNNHFDHIEEVKKLIFKNIKENKKIMIYGDYDADGIMGVSILKKAFQYLHYSNIGYYIPSRYLDGYGLTIEKAKEIIDKGYELVILVDNGITAFESVELLTTNGIKVIILDHHTPQEKIPCADYILHPLLSNFSSIATSGAFIAFVLTYYLLNRFDYYLSILASISLISDMMPLLDFNRDLLRIVIPSYREGIYLPLDLLKGENVIFNEFSIGLKISPKINAIGRIIKDTSINYLVEYFTSEDDKLIYKIYNWIDKTNERRKEITNKFSNDFLETDFKDEPAIILNINIDEGMLGLAANKLCKKWKKPVVVFTEDSQNNSLLKGSCRAPLGFNVVDAFNKLSNLIITSGGHACAGGLTIESKNFNRFIIEFKNLSKDIRFEETFDDCVDIGITSLLLENYYLVESFAPFGEFWPEPTFRIRRIKVSSLTYSKDNCHLLSSIGLNTRLVGFNISKESLSNFSYVDLIGNLKLSHFKGKTYLEFVVKNYKESI